MSVRPLTAADWRSMTRLRMARATHAGHNVAEFTSNPIAHVSARYQQQPHHVVGKFVDGQLVAYICCYAQPTFWVLDLMVASTTPNHLRECLEHCLQHYEHQGITQFYYAFPQKWARSYRSFWREGAESLRKYTVEDQTVILPRRVPTSEFIWDHILHQQVVAVPFLLRRSFYAESVAEII